MKIWKLDLDDPVVQAVATTPSWNTVIRDDVLLAKVNEKRSPDLPPLTLKDLNSRLGPTSKERVDKHFAIGVFRNCLKIKGERRCSYMTVAQKDRPSAEIAYATKNPPFPPVTDVAFWGNERATGNKGSHRAQSTKRARPKGTSGYTPSKKTTRGESTEDGADNEDDPMAIDGTGVPTAADYFAENAGSPSTSEIGRAHV